MTAPAESVDAPAIDLAEPGQALVCVEMALIGGDVGGEEKESETVYVGDSMWARCTSLFG